MKRDRVIEVAEATEEAVKAVAAQFGLSIGRVSSTYGNADVKVIIRFDEPKATIEKANSSLDRYGLHVGQKFTDPKGGQITITGTTRSRARRTPVWVLGTRSDGKKYKYTVSYFEQLGIGESASR